MNVILAKLVNILLPSIGKAIWAGLTGLFVHIFHLKKKDIIEIDNQISDEEKTDNNLNK